jgi:elongation factor G
MPTRAARRRPTAGGSTSDRAAIRNIGIMAHIDAGKTTTTERLLFLAGATSRLGEVDEGSTVTDWMPQEQARGISIVSASTTLAWQGHTVNLIDTPGHVDFTMEVERALRVLDGAIALFDAVAGVQPQSETVWRQADKHAIPRIAFVNKSDRAGADPDAVVVAISTRFGVAALLLQVAWRDDDGDLVGVIDLVSGEPRSWTDAATPPADLVTEAGMLRDELVERVAELDDELMVRFVAGEPVDADTLRAAIRRATIARTLVPVVLGAAKPNLGIGALLDAVIAYLPAPDELAPVRGHAVASEPDGSRAAMTRDPSVTAPTAALAFKVQDAAGAAPLTFVRVYAGRICVGDTLLNATRNRLEHVERLVRLHANRREDLRELPAGMIGAIETSLGAGGIGRAIATGDTLCDPTAPIILGPIDVPEPVVGVVVVPETTEDHTRLTDALERLAIEDPSFRVRLDAETGQTVIAGMGELHLEILLERLRTEFGVTARAGRPMVAYRESIRQRAEADERFVRSEPGRYGHVRLVVEPAERGSGNSVVATAPATEIPREYVPAVRAGVAAALERGVALGYPLTDVRVDVVGGSHHPVDSSASAFQVAGAMALTAAAASATPVVLEPVMSVEVVTPDDAVGDVLGDLHARRGKIAGVAARLGVQTVACFVPLSSMFGYASDLRSRTRGRATFSMEFQTYAEVPTSIRDELSRGRI